MTNYTEMKQQMEALREQMKVAAKAFFSDASKSLFEAHPELESFGWTQYTPYFNDGQPCVFSVHNDEPDVNGEDGYDIDEDNALVPAQKEVVKFLQTFTDDDMETMFGDHCRVLVTRTGIDVDEYSHD